MANISVDFSTREFRFSHGKEPKGYGSWAFEFEGRGPVWAPTSTYAEAKKWIKEHIRSVAPAGFVGIVNVNVLP
jgi:hypothetical protein